MCPPPTPRSDPNASGSVMKPMVFTVHDGKLILLTPQGTLACVEPSADNSNEISDAEDEIHIEIFRETTLHSHSNNVEEKAINNISSAYEAFWKADFENCLDRRTCVKCKQVFLTPQQLVYHLQCQHQVSIPEQCFRCLKYFTDEPEKIRHLRLSHKIGRPNSTCEVCFKVFSSEEEKNVHRLLHVETEKCRWCPGSFPCKYLLNLHLWHCVLQRSHQDCHICGCHFRSRHIRQLHSLRHNLTSCEICHISIQSLASERVEENTEILLMQHVKNFHSAQELQSYLKVLKKQDEEEGTLDELFMNQVESNLIQDCDMLNDEHPAEQVEEPLLIDAVPHGASQAQDANSKFSENSLQCSECLKTFGNNEELVKHEVEHQRGRSCHVCKKKFGSRKGFRAHVRSHGIEVKPSPTRYECKYCLLSCSTLSALRTHVLTHTDLKPFLCDMCGFRFRRPNTLKVHQQTVHNSRNSVSCPYCDLSTLSKKSLDRHIQNVHGGVRRFICGVCGSRFVQNQDLRRHLKAMHQLDMPPLSRISKKTNTEVHVIPAVTELNPADPLAELLKAAIEEEQTKLETINQKRKEANLDNLDHENLIALEGCVEEGQSLSILGDVASKAAPLDNTNSLPGSLNIQSSILQNSTECLSAETDGLRNISSPIERCQLENTMPLLSQENNLDVFSASSANAVRFVSSSKANSPCQYYLYTNQTVESDIEGASAAVSTDTTSLTYPNWSTLNAVTSLTNSVPCGMGGTYVDSLTINDETLEGSSAQTFLLQECPEIVDINTLSANLSQVDFLCPSILQEDFIASVDSSAIGNVIKSSQKQRKISTVQTQTVQNPGHLQETRLEQNCGFDFFNAGPETLEVRNEHLTEYNVQLTDQIVGAVLKRNMPCQTLGLIDLLGKGVPQGSSGGVEKIASNDRVLAESNMNQSRQLNQLVESDAPSGHNSILGDKKIATGLHTCSECGKEYSTVGSLQRHKKIHSDDRRAHTCSICGKHFQYKYNLAVHLVCHSGDRNYKCSLCKKAFKYQGELKEHTLLHEVSHPYTCEVCGQNFTRRRDYKRHLNSHGRNDKPTCHICQKSYSRMDYLRQHVKKHKKSGGTGSSPQNANKKLSKNNVSHLGKHPSNSSKQSETLFVCRVCSTCFASKAERAVHQKNCAENQESQESSTPILQGFTNLFENTLCDESSTAPCSSEDLIETALEASNNKEDFVFLEKINDLDQSQDHRDQSTADKTVLYVQIIPGE